MQPCGVCLPLLRSEPLCQQQQEQQQFFYIQYSRLALDFISDPQETLAQKLYYQALSMEI